MSDTLWGIPVVESDDITPLDIRVVAYPRVIRQEIVLERVSAEGEPLRLIGHPGKITDSWYPDE